jgi:twitching motility protein PilT
MEEQLEKLLKTTIEEGASDLHLSAGASPILRLARELTPLTDYPRLSAEDTKSLIFSLLDSDQRERLKVNKNLDFSFSYGDSRFRVNAYYSTGTLAAAFRQIPLEIPDLEELHLPEILKDFCELPQGFVLITGPAGQGKSTTIAAMLNRIAMEQAVHILTIEDLIEYIFKGQQRALINQREMHEDTLDWGVALRTVLREDPDVVFVGEMRDYETISSAVTIAETGHLVFSTLHTNSAAQTVNRIIDVFPEEEQKQIQTQLSTTLEAVVSQRLVPAIGGGVYPSCEILLSSPGIRNIIREGNTHQIDNVISTSLEQGMVSLERSLSRLVKEGKVERNVARRHTLKPQEFDRLIK